MDHHNFDTIRNNAEKDIKTVNNLEDFKVLKNKLIGDQSELAKINREIGNLEASQKAVIGQLVNHY